MVEDWVGSRRERFNRAEAAARRIGIVDAVIGRFEGAGEGFDGGEVDVLDGAAEVRLDCAEEGDGVVTLVVAEGEHEVVVESVFGGAGEELTDEGTVLGSGTGIGASTGPEDGKSDDEADGGGDGDERERGVPGDAILGRRGS